MKVNHSVLAHVGFILGVSLVGCSSHDGKSDGSGFSGDTADASLSPSQGKATGYSIAFTGSSASSAPVAATATEPASGSSQTIMTIFNPAVCPQFGVSGGSASASADGQLAATFGAGSATASASGSAGFAGEGLPPPPPFGFLGHPGGLLGLLPFLIGVATHQDSGSFSASGSIAAKGGDGSGAAAFSASASGGSGTFDASLDADASGGGSGTVSAGFAASGSVSVAGAEGSGSGAITAHGSGSAFPVGCIIQDIGQGNASGSVSLTSAPLPAGLVSVLISIADDLTGTTSSGLATVNLNGSGTRSFTINIGPDTVTADASGSVSAAGISLAGSLTITNDVATAPASGS